MLNGMRAFLHFVVLLCLFVSEGRKVGLSAFWRVWSAEKLRCVVFVLGE